MRLAPFLRLQLRQRSWTLSAVLAPPHDRGMTWSKWRFEVEPQLRHAPPSRCQTNSRVSTLMGSVSVGAAARRGLDIDREEVDLRRMGRLRLRNGAPLTASP